MTISRTTHRQTVLACALLCLGAAAPLRVEGSPASAHAPGERRAESGRAAARSTSDRSPSRLGGAAAGERRPRNLVLLIGDGMGVGQLSTASALLRGPAGGLTIEGAPSAALVRTHAADDLVPDSAAAGTALATGFRTARHVVSMLPGGGRLETLFELAHEHGLAVGVVTTSGLVDATPAAFLAHVQSRRDHAAILEQMLASGAEVMLGGDWTANRRARRDRAYRRQLRRLGATPPAGYSVVHSSAELAEVDGPVIGLFPPRPSAVESYGPPLDESTRAALRLLRHDPDGFVVMVECEDTDTAGHGHDLDGVVAGVRELDHALAAALELAGDDTLVVVTADHDTGGLGIVSAPLSEGRTRVRWATRRHTAQWVPLLAWGPGAERFAGILDQTEIPRLAASLLGLGELGPSTDSDPLPNAPPIDAGPGPE